MKPAISQVCSLDAPFEQDIADYAAAACRSIEIWLGKLETYLERHTLDDARALFAEHGVAAPVASFQGGLLISQGDARREHWAHFEQRLELCRQLGIGTLVVVGDLHGPLSGQDLERASLSLGQAAVAAAKRGVRIALEFQASATFGNNLQTAAAIVSEVNEPNLGICFDVFHYYLGPSKPDDFGALSAENLFHVQLSDLLGQPRELATDADRILPGDGDFLLEPIVDALRHVGYEGYVSLEVMNPQIWRIPPLQLAEVGITALRKVLGQASMS
jgi:2-keto-myo-inositol isomerase